MGVSYFLRTTDALGRSHGGFQWPLEIGAVVSAPDWSPKPVCGGGLHGLRNGLGDASLLDWQDDALWWIVEADDAEAVDLSGKWKFPACRVIAFGPQADVTAKLYALCPGPIHGLMMTGGYRATLTGGDEATLTGGAGLTLDSPSAGDITVTVPSSATAGLCRGRPGVSVLGELELRVAGSPPVVTTVAAFRFSVLPEVTRA